jgi:hypothetical protein
MVDRLIERVAALGAAARGPIVVGAFGLAIGVAAFWATSFHDFYTFLGPLGVEEILQMPGYDPITGQPHGRIYIRSDAFMDPEVVTREVVDEPPPDGMKPAIPVPVGTAVGVFVALLVRRLDRRLSRPQLPDVAAGGPAPS